MFIFYTNYFPPKLWNFFCPWISSNGAPKKGCESESLWWVNQTITNHTSRGSSPEPWAALAAFPRVQTLGLSAAVCCGAAGSLPQCCTPGGVRAVHTGLCARTEPGPATMLLLLSVGRGWFHLEWTIFTVKIPHWFTMLNSDPAESDRIS